MAAEDEITALIVRSPAAEPVVGDLRARLDRSARVGGVPAHVTVLVPFLPHPDESDHRSLAELFARCVPFTMTGARTAWFGETVVYVEPADPAPFVELTTAVAAAYPACPPYGGAFDAVTPHLTIGHDQGVEMLRVAEREVLPRLPFRQRVDHVELWTGPDLAGGRGGRWRHVRDYALGAARL